MIQGMETEQSRVPNTPTLTNDSTIEQGANFEKWVF